ncbi:MAG: DNA polymerase III subunit delta [Rhizobiaceae bacterium]
MAQKKTNEVESWLARPQAEMRIVLLYGPDRGLVSERAAGFAARTGLALDDPFSVLKLDAAELAGDSGRLIDEARSIPMFGGERLIWLRNAGNDKALVDALDVLCVEPPRDALLLVEAGDLKKGSALRRTVEQGGSAIALPCYADTARAIDALIDEEMDRVGLSISLEARQLLKNLLGGDRLASRSEIEKLALYCRGAGRVDAKDVLASIGDVSALSQDAVVDAILAGDTGSYDRAYSRLISSGANPFVALAAMMRQLQALQPMRDRLEQGAGSAASIVASARPPVFFARRGIVENALSRWSGELIVRALDRLQTAVLHTRQNADLSASIARQTLLSLCLESARRRK